MGKVLVRLGFVKTNQTGSHMKYTICIFDGVENVIEGKILKTREFGVIHGIIHENLTKNSEFAIL